jgi:hypothetical protein
MRAVRIVAAAAILALVPPAVSARRQPAAAPVQRATVTVQLDRVLSRFRPAALGAGLDGLESGGVKQVYTPRNLRLMAGAGLGSVSYRLRTELGVEAWHWNARGSWSQPRRHQGYWTGSAIPGRPAAVTYGYRLPRRGNSVDQANDDGFSRLDDGSRATFWKSNPYLDRHFTREPDSLHRQWLLIDFGRPVPLDAIRLAWGRPFARRIRAEYWVGLTPIYFYAHPGRWAGFPRASFSGRPGIQTLRLARRPNRVRFVRLVLSRSSHSGPPGSRDIRDRLGFAIRELYAGTIHRGRLLDVVRHAADGARQTTTYVSSTDPWHRASDRDPRTEQPSFQTVVRSGLARGNPLQVPVPVLYGTPADARAELRYLRALRVPVGRVEMGEEPDGQLASPEDYGSLYSQVARRLRRDDPRLQMGGPGYQTAFPDWRFWPDASGQTSWTRRFLDELDRRHARAALSFFSFEWYPFDDGCAAPGPQLLRQPRMLASILARQTADGLPPSLPKVISEYGWSAFANRAEVGLPGALMDADIAAGFLSLGGSVPYLYGYEPATLIQELRRCNSWGNLALLQADNAGQVIHPLATWWGMRMMTRDWVQPGNGVQTMHPVHSTALDPAGRALVSAYALTRPDGSVALLLLNKDQRRAWRVAVESSGAAPGALAGPFEQWQLSDAQYRWHPRGERGYPAPDRAPSHVRVAGTPGADVVLPPSSLTVLRTRPARQRP